MVQRRARIASWCVAVLVFPSALLACLWDSDTLRAEAKGLPGIAEIIAGRFERPPALYYEMRLERVTAELTEHPDDLALYDDAAVACDRLGRGDEAVAWLEQKKSRLDAMDPQDGLARDHLYRYHANLGTVLAHRWIRSGADRADMADMIAGREHIARAIELNPNAHFGRERYQLLAMDWIINPPELDPDAAQPASLFSMHKNAIGAGAYGILQYRSLGLDDGVEGLTGLIVLGNAWESFDVFYALAMALEGEGHATMGYLARLRCIELVKAGHGSFHPDMPEGQALIGKLSGSGVSLEAEDVKVYYPKARAAAERWREHWQAFMLERLRAGRHPDTDEAFWEGYREVAAPALPNGWLGMAGHRKEVAIGLAALAAGTAATLALVLMLVRLVRSRRRAACMVANAETAV